MIFKRNDNGKITLLAGGAFFVGICVFATFAQAQADMRFSENNTKTPEQWRAIAAQQMSGQPIYSTPMNAMAPDILDVAVSRDPAQLPAPRMEGAHAAQQGALETLESVLVHAYRHNPSLRAARTGLLGIQERLPQAQAGWRPTIEATGDVQWNDIDGSNFGADGTTSKTFGVGFTQPLYRGGRTVAGSEEAHKQIWAQRALLRSLEQDMLRVVATTYVDVVRDQAIVMLREHMKKVVGEVLHATRERFSLGEVTRTDVAQAEARFARADADMVRAIGNLKISRAGYVRVVGHEPGRLGHPVLNFSFSDDLHHLVQQAEAANPSVLAASYLHESAEFNVDEVFGELLPSLQFFGNWQREYDPQPGVIDESTVTALGISARIPLYQAGSVRSRVRQAKHVANQRYIEILDSRRNVKEQVTIAWQNLQAVKAEIASREVQVRAAATAQEGVREEAFLGMRTVLDTLDADQELVDAETALFTAHRDKIVAEFDLASSIGILTPEILGIQSFDAYYDAHLEDIQSKIFGLDVDIAPVNVD